MRIALTLRLRIAGASFGFLGLVCGVGYLAHRQNAQLGAMAVGIYDSAVRGMNFGSGAQTEMLRFNLSHTGAAALDADAKAELQTILDKLEVAKTLASTPHTQEALAAANASVVAVQSASPDKLPGAITAANKALNKVVQRFSSDALEVRDSAEALAKSSGQALLAAVGIAMAASLAVAFALLRSVVPPIRNALTVAKAIAQGRLDNHIAAKGQDETAQLLRALAEMQHAIADNLATLQAKRDAEAQQAEITARRATTLDQTTKSFEAAVGSSLGRLAEAAATLRGASEDMRAAAEDSLHRATTVSEAAQQTSSRVQTVAAATEELTASIQEVGGRIDQATQIVASAVTQARETNATVQGLTEAAQKIGAIVDVIRGIAEQTNLLALNATIEAARAGETGRGFAVVAGEVKALANQTARATEEIASRIQSMQTETQQAASAINRIGSTINTMNDLTVAIATAMDQQGSATAEIARNVTAAATGTGQVSDNIESVTQSATNVGAAAVQVLDAATALNAQSDDLQHQVQSFLDTVRAA